MGRLEGKVAVVTGGANGIGRATCLRFAEEGARLVVADLLDDPGKQVVSELEQQGANAVYCHLDAASPADNDAMAATAVDRFGGIDVLVTAAGISHGEYSSGDTDRDTDMVQRAAAGMGDPGAGLVDLDLGAWQKVLDVNLTGTLLAIKACAPQLLDGGGSVVTIASIAAKVPEAGPLAYAVSKSGVWMLTKSLSRQLAPGGVRVNAIGPGFIETNMTHFIHSNDAIRQMALMRIPLGRIGQPEDVANTALFLASDESSYFTGEILHPDGGFYTD